MSNLIMRSAETVHLRLGYGRDQETEDYKQTLQDGDVSFGLCEIQGDREAQEDYLMASASLVADLPYLYDVDVKRAYLATFKELQMHYAQVEWIGATCCTTAAWMNTRMRLVTTWTAHVGDAKSFAVILDKSGYLKKTVLLNRPHNEKNKAEMKRLNDIVVNGQHFSIADEIKKTGRFPLSHVNMTRAFGDKVGEIVGFSHKPEIKQLQLPLAQDEMAYIIVACDGLTEQLTDRQVGELVSEKAKESKTVSDIAEALVIAGYESGSYDNISVGVFEVGKNPASVIVVDGHGGLDEEAGVTASQLAKKIGDAFYPTFSLIAHKARSL